MTKKILPLFLSLFIIGFVAAQKTTAITCGQVLNTRTGEILQNQVIFIKGNLNVQPTDKILLRYLAGEFIDQ